MTRTTAEILDAAADLIEPEGAWTQEQYATNAAGNSVAPKDKSAVCWCLIGALARTTGLSVADVHYPGFPLISTVAKVVDDCCVGIWNDAPDRTQSEVVAALRGAAQVEREKWK